MINFCKYIHIPMHPQAHKFHLFFSTYVNTNTNTNIALRFECSKYIRNAYTLKTKKSSWKKQIKSGWLREDDYLEAAATTKMKNQQIHEQKGKKKATTYLLITYKNEPL